MRPIPSVAASLLLVAGSCLADAAPTLAWSVTTGDTPPLVLDHVNVNSADVGPRSAIDAAGNLYVAASSIASSPSNSCGVYLKYSAADGGVVWRRSICAADFNTFSGSLALDPSGNVLVTGAVSGQLYVAKLSAVDGSIVWQQGIGGGAFNAGYSIGVDAAGDARVAGFEGGNTGDITVYGFAGGDGALQFIRPLPNSLGSARLLAFAVDSNGGSALAEFDTDGNNATAERITRLGALGSVVWQSPGAGEESLAIDPNGNVVTSSSVNGIEKYDAATGNRVWMQPAAHGAITTDSAGNIYVTGAANRDASTGETDIGTWKVAPDGSLAWTNVIADPTTHAAGVAIALDGGGSVFVAAQVPLSDGTQSEQTIKYSATDGTIAWTAADHDASVANFAYSIHANTQGIAELGAAFEQGTSNRLGLRALKYSESTGGANPTRLGNISSRGDVLNGDDVMIGGFIIGGSTNKTVAIVATGPSLASFGVSNPLLNPTLTLVRQSDHAVIATNDDWQSDASAAQLQASGFAPPDPREPGLYVSLPPGAYTAIVSGVGGTTGVAVIAVFEVDHPETPLVNLSTRGLVQTGDNVMIGGLIIEGNASQTVAVTATGPSLSAYGIANPLANPTLTLVRQSDSTVIATNDDWQTDPNAAQLQLQGFAPSDPHEAGMLITLPPGAYTAIVSGVNNTTGVSVVGVFAAH